MFADDPKLTSEKKEHLEDAYAILHRSIVLLTELASEQGDGVLLSFFNENEACDLEIKYIYKDILLQYLPQLFKFKYIQLLFKFGLSATGQLQWINAQGMLDDIQPIDWQQSAQKNSRRFFSILKDKSGTYFTKWWEAPPTFVLTMLKSEIGLQALVAHNYRFMQEAVAHYQPHALNANLKQILFIKLAQISIGRAILKNVAGLIELLGPEHINHCVSTLNPLAFIFYASIPGRGCYNQKNGLLLKHINAATLMTLHVFKKDIYVPWIVCLIADFEGRAWLVRHNFYLLRQLTNEAFNQVIFAILALPEKLRDRFIHEAIVKVIFAWYPSGRRFLGLPAGSVDQSLVDFLNVKASHCTFDQGQTILHWLCHSHLGMQLLETHFINHAILDQLAIQKLCVYGDPGKRILKKVAANGMQTVLTARLTGYGFFSHHKRDISGEKRSLALCSDDA